MKYLFSLFFVLCICFSAMASDCPTDKPLLGNDGICHSCDEKDTIIINGEKQSCSVICPNRSEGNGFYLSTETPCVAGAISFFDGLTGFVVWIVAGVFCVAFVLSFLFLLHWILKLFKKKK